MNLSKKLKQDHECGDFGNALAGYSEQAERLALLGGAEWVRQRIDKAKGNQNGSV